MINTLTGIHQIVLFCFYFVDIPSVVSEPSWWKKEKEEIYWKRFSEKSSEEEDIHSKENILIVENLLTGGGSFSENFGSVGNQNSDEHKAKSKSVEQISQALLHKSKPLPKTALIYNQGVRALHEVIWGKENSGNKKDSSSSQLPPQPVQKSGPRISSWSKGLNLIQNTSQKPATCVSWSATRGARCATRFVRQATRAYAQIRPATCVILLSSATRAFQVGRPVVP